MLPSTSFELTEETDYFPTSDSFVYVTDDGETVAPEEETSLLMSLGILEHSENVHYGDREGEVPYFENPVEFDCKRLAAEARFESFMKNVETNGDDFEETRTDDEMPAFSREVTTIEEEWIIERILDRRFIKGGKGGDYAVFYDDFGNKETGMLNPGHLEYLCKWKGYVEPTWETKELLEDEGFLRECRSYDDAHSVVCRTRVIPSLSDVFPQYAVKQKKLRRESVEYNELVFGEMGPLNEMFSLSMDEQRHLLQTNNLNLYGYGCCATDDNIQRFIKTYRSKQKSHRPIFLYHGSQIANLPSICKNGLRVPRTPRDITHGSGYGIGIYAAFSPSVSVRYCHSPTACRLLLCIGLVSNNDPNVKMIPNFCVVFRQPELILPVVAMDVHFLSRPHKIERRVHTFESLGILPAVRSQPKPKPQIDENGNPVSASMQRRALNKVRNRNILLVNRMAQKMGAGVRSGDPKLFNQETN